MNFPREVAADGVGTVVHRANYRPYGDRLLGVPTLTESKAYIGERFDEETGLMYLHARYYDPLLARFVQPDPTSPTTPGVEINRYAYALNNPISRFDPPGLGSPQENDEDPSSSNYGRYSDARAYGLGNPSSANYGGGYNRSISGLELSHSGIISYRLCTSGGCHPIQLGYVNGPLNPRLTQLAADPESERIIGVESEMLTEGQMQMAIEYRALLDTIGRLDPGNQILPALTQAGRTFVPTPAQLSEVTEIALRLSEAAQNDATIESARPFSPSEVQGLRELFGYGPTGAQGLLNRLAEGQVDLPSSINTRTLEQYEAIAQRAIDAGKDKIGTQALRLDAIRKLLNQ